MYTIKWFNKGYVEYTLVLDQTKSSPASMVSLWQSITQQEIIDFFWAYPVLLENWGGKELKLNKTNLQQLEDWSSASSYNASTNWDVMTKFPRRGYKFSTASNVTTITVTSNPHAESDWFVYYPFQRIISWSLWGSDAKYDDKDAFYLACYEWVNSSGLRSRYNQTPQVSQTIWTFAWYAQNRGTRYWIVEFVQQLYLEIMDLFIFKNTNAQSVLWRWYVDASWSNYPWPKTGVNTYNLIGSTTLSWAVEWCYGTSSWTVPMVFMWLEHWYWGILDWTHWWWQTSSWIYISIPNSDGSNRTSSYSYTPANCSAVQSSISLTNWAYITKVRGDNLCWFTPTNNSWGSESSYFADYARWGSGSRVAEFGGGWDDASRCGAFCWGLGFDASYSSAYVGSRLMFL